MKVAAPALKKTLSKAQFAPLFLVVGDEPLQVLESHDALRQYLHAQGFTERDVYQVDKKFDWERVLLSTQELSLFADKKSLEIRMGGTKLDKSSTAHLLRWLNNPPPDVALLLFMEKADAATQKSPWFQQIEKQGLHISIQPVEAGQLVSWLQQRAAAMGLHFTEEALQFLADSVEGNLLAARQELEKLALLFPGQTLNEEQLVASIADSARFDVFALTEAALAAQPDRCVRILSVLKLEGFEAPVVLWALTREIRTLYGVLRGLQQGQSYDAIAQQLRIWGKRKPLIKQAAHILSLQTLEGLLKQAHEADQAIKGIAHADAWMIMQDIVLHLSGQTTLQELPEV